MKNLLKTTQFNGSNTAYIKAIFASIIIALIALAPAGLAFADDGSYDDSGSSGSYYDGGSSGSYYDSGSSGSYSDSGSSGSYYDSPSSGSYYDSGSSGSYNDTSSAYVTPYDTYTYDNSASVTPYDTYVSSPSYSSYTPYTSGGCSSCGGSSYHYTPYTYTPSSGGYRYVQTGASSASAPSYHYVSAVNTNGNTNTPTASNTNTIANNPTNIFNPTNNNTPSINLIVLGGGTGANTQQGLDGSCTINPTTAYAGQNLSFYASATGGNGSYTYYWTGDNGLSASSQSFSGQFLYSGYKTATVTISSNGQTITRTCSVNVLGGTAVASNTNGNPVSGVFLDQVPATGINMSLKLVLFSTGIILWSAFVAFMFNEQRKKNARMKNLIAG